MLCNSEILGRIQRWKFCVFLLKCVVFVCFTPIFGDTPWIQRCDSLVCLCFLLCSSPPKNGINKGIPLCYLFFIRGEETWFFLYGCLFSSSWMVGFRSKTKITKLKSSLKNKTTNSMYLIYIPKNAITSLTFWKMNPWTHHRKNNIMSKSKFICGTIDVLFNTWIHLHIMYLYVRQHKSTLTNAGLEQIKSILRASFQGLKRVFCNLFLRVLWQSQMYTYIYISKYLSNHLLLLYLHRNLYDLLFDGHKLTLHSFFVVCRPWKFSNFQPMKPQRQQHSEWWISSPSSPRSVTQDFHHWKL